MPRNVLDLAIAKKINKRFEIKAGIKDIFNQQVRLVQAINTTVNMDEINNTNTNETKHFKRDQVTKSYQPGRYITLGITYKL